MSRIRFIMIQSIKFAPYITMLCIALSYIELLYAYTFDLTIECGDYYEYYTPLKENVFSICNYDWYSVLILFCASRVMDFCMYHVIPIGFMAINLIFKTYLNNVIIDDYFVPYIISINIFTIAVIAVLVTLHVKQLRRDRRTNKTTSDK